MKTMTLRTKITTRRGYATDLEAHSPIDSAASSTTSFPVLPLLLFQLTGLRFMKAPTAPR